MSLIQRYFFRQLLLPFVIAMLAFASLALLTQSLSNIDLISGYSETALTFLKVTVLALPHLSALLLPIALFVAALAGLNRLSGDSELIVGQAAGMSRWKLIDPLLRLGMMVMILNLAVNLFIQPLSYREMRRSLYDLRSDEASSLVSPGQFSRLGPGVTIYARERTRDGRLLDILIHDNRDETRAATITARESRITRVETRPTMTLIDGNQHWFEENGSLNYITFDQTQFDLGEFIGPVDAMFFKESDRFLHELIWPDAATLSRGRGPERPLAEAHYRLSAPLYNLAFVLIAGAVFLGGNHSRMGQGRRIMMAAGLGLTLRLLGFAVQSASADDPSVNIAQYIVPLAGCVGAIAVIYWPRRKRPLTASTSSRAAHPAEAPA